MAHEIVLRGYKIERNWLRTGGFLRSGWFIALVCVASMIVIEPTSGLSIIFLPIIVGFLRNRPMAGIFWWDILLGWAIIGWIVAMVKAFGNK